MQDPPDNVHPIFGRILGRSEKERLLGQRALVVWFYGLSGSGKSTLANALERRLHEAGRFTKLLDGDNIRSRLNRDLGFSDEDRSENIRRIAEVARLFLDAGAIVLCSFITPRQELRDLAHATVGPDDFLDVFVDASFEECARRDVKGLYAQAESGRIARFTGRDSGFERPENPGLHLDTERLDEAGCLRQLHETIAPRIQLS